jgi:hypothetical protein
MSKKQFKKHQHCEHKLKHCSHCDVVYCEKCDDEWVADEWSDIFDPDEQFKVCDHDSEEFPTVLPVTVPDHLRCTCNDYVTADPRCPKHPFGRSYTTGY